MWTFASDMFQLSIPVAEKILRPVVVYVFLVVFLRVFGKRELAQLNPFDLVVLLSLSNTVQNAIIGVDNSVTGGLIGAFALMATNYLVVRFLFRHRRLDQVLEGSPTVLIERRKVQRGAPAKELLTQSELNTVLHRQGFMAADDVERCVLEPGGVFSIQTKRPPREDRQHAEVIDNAGGGGRMEAEHMADTLLRSEGRNSHKDQTRFVGVILAAAAVLALSACTSCDRLPAPRATTESPSSAPPTERVVGPLTPADAAALATMNDRLKQYVDLHNKVQQSLPTLPKEATPQQIDKNQRAMERLVREARAKAKPGDIFTPDARPVIRRLLATVFGGPDGKQLKAAIMDENQAAPSAVKLTVNGRYPDTVPLATVPPQVLQTLPMLTEDLEYRFIGDSLILLDVHAHVIADFIEDVVPK